MVLTQLAITLPMPLLKSFHTTMVLTQRYGEVEGNSGYIVSIPLWFSRNVIAVILGCALEAFPYHYGSHATEELRDALKMI